ncbi:D-2-hydroxyacid dehydrogenase [Legionella longbeachae]|uniref:Putative 2-hydroxyacid dehydrogenase, D-isomer specific n=2 Tax=Legionella longbeachae TaxID=450 RepID=D3HSA1_LEGLN|nr:D-2-hydroxyacid dehydrogenase [Legionella longbeachae]UAK45384.1 D-2-hydroxyacid dehydrogenase [Legionella longbeachae]CBJ11785.1 putative 2-hydroxyacid dehydrogenase, D-isomer specific [Legionella longbeachae NSW150]VEE02284.1 2-hydroxyacid dehydrogenase [Legionella oakridgensis]HBD7398226.1 D-2-hydroxyacid dehydrogenase [Legionella pneumophila]
MKKNNIVVLDSKPLMSDGLCLDSLNKLGEVTLYDRTPDDLVIDRASEAEIIITNKVKLTEQHFNKLPRLRYIGETATGVDNIDIRAAAKHRIIVTNVPDYSTDSVAQHVLALLLTHTNHVEAHNQSIQRGEWQTQPYFSYWSKPVIELAGMTLGLMGYGRVAQKVARLAGALGMKIIAHKPTMFTDELVSWVSFSDLLKQSDVLSLHCPLNEYTKSMINNETLKQMKPTAVLINTGRGGLINESDLANALKAKQITAAYLDVLSEEPPRINNRLIGLTNCIITPHIAWASVAARKRLLNTVCENIIHFLKGQPINVIRPS